MLSEVPGLHHFDAYLDAFADLNSSEIAAAVLALGVLMSIGSSATNTRPSGAQHTTDGCFTSGAERIISSFQSDGGVGRAANAECATIKHDMNAKRRAKDSR